MPKINAKPDSVEGLLQALPSGSLPARYLKLLRRCREKGYPVGAMEEVV